MINHGTKEMTNPVLIDSYLPACHLFGAAPESERRRQNHRGVLRRLHGEQELRALHSDAERSRRARLRALVGAFSPGTQTQDTSLGVLHELV